MISGLIEGLMGGFIPLFYSYKAIKRGTKNSLVHWLKYWVVYAVFHVITFFLELFFLSHLIPFYGMIKAMFLIWCVNPYTSGAQFMYDKVLRSMISRYERRVGKQIALFISSVMDWTPLLFSQDPPSFYKGNEEASEVEIQTDNDECVNVVPIRRKSSSFSNGPSSLVFNPRFMQQDPMQDYCNNEDGVSNTDSPSTRSLNVSRGDISDRVDIVADETTSEDDVSLHRPTLRRSTRAVTTKKDKVSELRGRKSKRTPASGRNQTNDY
ncbi:unnamed protein product [Auanema sp. JU1783]|nr:unnamed protein product [Auanema sp. JU1783]